MVGYKENRFVAAERVGVGADYCLIGKPPLLNIIGHRVPATAPLVGPCSRCMGCFCLRFPCEIAPSGPFFHKTVMEIWGVGDIVSACIERVFIF